MKNQISYSPEVRERAVRLVFARPKEYESQFDWRGRLTFSPATSWAITAIGL